MKRLASATWLGTLKEGRGSVSTESGALAQGRYSYGTRFDKEPGTNPEELIAAAHASCFSMALAGQLAILQLQPDRIVTTATVTLEKLEQGFVVTAVHLEVFAEVPGADVMTFSTAAEEAKKTCPISRLLNAKITLSAHLEQADTLGLAG